MANTYTNLFVHAVFRTKNREPFISAALRNRLFPYIGGIAKQNKFKIICIGGAKDHTHVLVSLNPNISVAKAVQLIKGGSSKWIHEMFPHLKHFAWQEGYGAFSIGISQIEDARKYIEHQERHHRNVSFQEEYLEFLRKNDITFDEKYVFG